MDHVKEFKDWMGESIGGYAKELGHDKLMEEEFVNEEVEIPCGLGNSYPIRMLVHTHKDMKGKKGLVPYVTLYQGGCIGGSEDINAPYACYWAK